MPIINPLTGQPIPGYGEAVMRGQERATKRKQTAQDIREKAIKIKQDLLNLESDKRFKDRERETGIEQAEAGTRKKEAEAGYYENYWEKKSDLQEDVQEFTGTQKAQDRQLKWDIARQKALTDLATSRASLPDEWYKYANASANLHSNVAKEFELQAWDMFEIDRRTHDNLWDAVQGTGPDQIRSRLGFYIQRARLDNMHPEEATQFAIRNAGQDFVKVNEGAGLTRIGDTYLYPLYKFDHPTEDRRLRRDDLLATQRAMGDVPMNQVLDYIKTTYGIDIRSGGHVNPDGSLFKE